MPKQALLATPSLAVSLALSRFAASVIKDEERKSKRLRTSSSAVRKAADRCGEDVVVAGDETEAEGSTNRVKTKKRSHAQDDRDSFERLARSTTEPSTSSLNSDENGGDDDGGDVLQNWSLPTDTLVALKMMCQQFPKIDEVAVCPFVLKSQLYSSVSDRTTADRQLEELKQQHVVRIFKLNSGKDDFGVMLIEDYLQQIEAEKKYMLSKRSEEETSVFDWFATRVVPAHTGVSIRHPHLMELLSQAGKVNDKQISLLINSGLLLRQIADEATYWFGIPNVGSLLKSLSAGRKELLSFLSRRRYKEMIQAALEKKKLRSSQFNMRFHVRDLLGSGHLYSIHTPVGPLIRLKRN